MGDPRTDPHNDPTSEQYWYDRNEVPPWAKAGYGSSESWRAAQDQQTQLDQQYRQNQIDLQQKQINASGASNGPAWANVGMRGRELDQSASQFGQNLSEQQRQFNENMGKDKSMFDQKMALDQASQKWKEAVDSRDFEAANFWKSRSQELQQNQLSLDYTKTLAGLSGPQDWMKYNRLSRGESPLGNPDGTTVPLDKALPAWAQGVTPGTYGYGQTGGRGFGGPAANNAAPTGPAWAQPTPGGNVPNQVYNNGKAVDTHMFDPGTGAYQGTMRDGQKVSLGANDRPSGLYQPTNPALNKENLSAADIAGAGWQISDNAKKFLGAR